MSPMMTRIELERLTKKPRRRDARAGAKRKAIGYTFAAAIVLLSALAMALSYIKVVMPCAAC